MEIPYLTIKGGRHFLREEKRGRGGNPADGPWKDSTVRRGRATTGRGSRKGPRRAIIVGMGKEDPWKGRREKQQEAQIRRHPRLTLLSKDRTCRLRTIVLRGIQRKSSPRRITPKKISLKKEKKERGKMSRGWR